MATEKTTEKTLSLAGTVAMGGLSDASPRVHAPIDAPMANPMYLSDSPSFLQRQRSRAARFLVSEHVSTVTCRCLQCQRAARGRVQPDYGFPCPQSMRASVGDTAYASFATGGALASTAPPSLAEKWRQSKQTEVKIDEARQQIKQAREVQGQPEPEAAREGQLWREAAFKSHRCLAHLRTKEQELSQIQAALRRGESPEELSSALTHKQQELRQAGTAVEEAKEELERVCLEDPDVEFRALQALEMQTTVSQPKGFVWFLKVAAVCARAEASGPGASAGAQGRLGALGQAVGAGSLEAKLGVKIPDTVILEKGKPQKRYSLDAHGRVQVTPMKTSAELLRVLRDFVRKATRPRLPPPCNSRRVSVESCIMSPPAQAMPRSKSESTFHGRRRAGRSESIMDGGFGYGGGIANPMTEVAVLYYCIEPSLEDSRSRGGLQGATGRLDDGRSRTPTGQANTRPGAVRLMTYAEALAQMKGVGKLPREFWQHIQVLQMPVQSVQVGAPTRYITYNYDAAGGGEIQPQEPVPLGHWHSGPARPESGGTTHDEAARVAAVARRINECLLKHKHGKFYLVLVSGQFEFVLDQADGSLWLVNASRLIIERRREFEDMGPKVEEVKYFDEEEFAQRMREQDLWLTQNIKRFVSTDPNSPKAANGVPTFTLNAADRLAQRNVPDELIKYYEAEHEMHRYYTEEVVTQMDSKQPKWNAEGGRAVGLQAWFRRWARAAGVHSRRGQRGLLLHTGDG